MLLSLKASWVRPVHRPGKSACFFDETYGSMLGLSVEVAMTSISFSCLQFHCPAICAATRLEKRSLMSKDDVCVRQGVLEIGVVERSSAYLVNRRNTNRGGWSTKGIGIRMGAIANAVEPEVAF